DAVRETLRQYDVPPERTLVGYSAHGELGQRVVVHIHLGSKNDVHDPFLFLTHHEGFGASLSGFLGDKLGDAIPTSASWSVARGGGSGDCSVAGGFYYTAEEVDSAEDSAPLQRLASKMGVPLDILEGLLEMPVTEWMPASSAPTAEAIAVLQSRLAWTPLP